MMEVTVKGYGVMGGCQVADNSSFGVTSASALSGVCIRHLVETLSDNVASCCKTPSARATYQGIFTACRYGTLPLRAILALL